MTAGALPPLSGLIGVEHENGRTRLLTSDADGDVRALVRSDVPFTDLEVRSTSLEEAFLAITAPRR